MTDRLAQIIKSIRTAAGDSPAKAAEKIGISRQGYMKWEQGDTSNMKLGNLLTFCDKYKVPIEKVIRGNIDSVEQTDDQAYPAPIISIVHTMEKRPAEYSADEKTIIDGFKVADEGLRRGMLALARESIAVFEKRNEHKN